VILLLILGVVLAFLALALGALAILGRSLPETHVATTAVRLSASPRAVWAVLSDFATWPSWAPGIQSAERLPDRRGHVVWKLGSNRQSMPVEAEVAEPSRRLVTLIDDPALPYGGRWIWEIRPDGASGSRVSLTEDGFIRPPLFRALAKHVLGYDRTQRTYLKELATKLGESSPKLERLD
jgi:hypothetical protein